MVSLSKFLSSLSLLFLINPVSAHQSYDTSTCTSASQLPGANYVCDSQNFPCQSYLIYRAQENYQSLSSVSVLFEVSLHHLLDVNNLTEPESSNITLGREIIIPIDCLCISGFSRSIFKYNLSGSGSFSQVACQVFEGLVKEQTLVQENPDFSGRDPNGEFVINVPIKCACPDEKDSKSGVNYLVTYPVVEKDDINLIARKFDVTEQMIWDANKLEPFATIFSGTTLLVPTRIAPVLNWIIDPLSRNAPVIPLTKVTSSKISSNLKSRILLAGVLAVVFVIILAVLAVICVCKKKHPRNFKPLSAKKSVFRNFSRDFLDGVSKLKHSLTSFSLEELTTATNDFNEACVIGKAVYRGTIRGSYVAIEQMCSSEAACHVICILTKINHVNIAKLEGCCYGNTPYLVFEFAENGSLRDCLSNANMAIYFTWAKRMQIALDVAVAIHYIHYCTKPAYVHRNINSRNVLITSDWRAKISGFRLAKAVISSEEKEVINWNESVIVGRKEYLAPEYLSSGIASLKVDVFAFGIVLLELLSGKEVITTEGKFLKDSVEFLGNGGFECFSGCLEKLKEFMDPVLDGDFPLADAACLALLTKGCLEEDPLHRPTMNNVIKALSRMV